MQALSEKVQELETRLDELAEIDTLRARVKVLEEQVRGHNCGGELVEGAKLDGAKDAEGKTKLQDHTVCNNVGGSAREYSNAGCEHSGVGLREVVEANESCAGGEAGYRKVTIKAVQVAEQQ